ncbi:Integrase family protein [Planktothrix serta PCC 8927]|uniref:Integrase family protein n=1 Tax=Planktothrix serta PCC 8927 TaxID=671068 RepID=A0A7Z9E141_9CYAN|nr:tyrosine-type recombinase/integrase [Planktothrix serta]VXD22381.1 Integrase family protein [Planktothrix serta PCC 8927]
MKTFTYSPRGLARIERNGENLRIVFPRSLFNGKVKTFALGLKADSPTDRKKAEEICNAINADIRFDQLDVTLERYKPRHKSHSYKNKVSELYPDIALVELYQKFIEYKKPTWKIATLHHRTRCILPLIKKSGVTSPYQALELRQWLVNNTSEGYTKKVLQQINAAFKWALSAKLLRGDNPFDGMAKEFKDNYERNEPEPNAFTQEEKEKILEAFRNHVIPGNSYRHYYPLVQFLFLTGCRPSEAIGLKWGNVNNNHVAFKESITTVGGKVIKNQGSKNNKVRKFPMNQALREFMNSIKPDDVNVNDLVFPSPEGSPINYNNFSQRAWDKIVDPIVQRNTTPYSCRDTFITEQVNSSVPTLSVAKWCDTSVSIIEKHYFDSTVNLILPV